MKKAIFIFVSFILLSSCSKSEEITNSDGLVKNSSNYSRFVGTNLDDYHLLHNKALDEFFKDVESDTIFYFGDIESDLKEDRAYTLITKYLKSNVSLDIDETWLDSFFDRAKNINHENNQDFIRVKSSEYYVQLLDVIESETSIESANDKINFLITKLELDNDLRDFDKIALKSALLIGKESFTYWTLNDEKWETLGRSSSYSKPKKNKKAIMQADVEGAVSGAITGAMTGAPFAGAGAGAGALLGAMMGAAWGSAVSGAFQHFGIWD